MSRVLSVTLLLLFIALPLTADGQHSLYRDVKADNVGDIITVILMENISGSSASDSRTASRADGGASGSVSGNFLPFEPVFGSDVSVQYNSDERNLANQQQLLEGYMSVQIVEVTSRGDLIVEGARMTEINGEKHEMMLTGVIRPNDVNSRNQVYSWRVAGAVISYQKEEGLNEAKKRRGLLRRIAFGGVTAILAAILITGEL